MKSETRDTSPCEFPKSRSPDPVDLQPLNLTDLFLVAYLEMQGNRIEPCISYNGPFENMISFDVHGDDVEQDIADYHEHPVITEFLKSYKKVRHQMWTMKEVAKRRQNK